MPKAPKSKQRTDSRPQHREEHPRQSEPPPLPEFAGSPEDEGFAWLQWSLIHSMGIDPGDASCWSSLYREMSVADNVVELLADMADVRDDERQAGDGAPPAEADERY